jgi:hypothetical protein
MLGGAHRFEFVGRDPLIFRLLVALLFANTFSRLLLPPLLHYLKPAGFPGTPPCQELMAVGVPYHVPWAVCWLESRFVIIQSVLSACIVGVFLIFRKQVRYIRKGRSPHVENRG